MQIVVWFFSFVIFIGGLVMMGYSFATPGYELVMFLGGMVRSLPCHSGPLPEVAGA